LRPLIGITGTIRNVINDGAILHIMYPSGAEAHVTATMGIVTVPAVCEDPPIAETPTANNTSRCFTVRLPLPPHCASPNARVDHRMASRRIREYRERCAALIVEAGVPSLRTPTVVSLTYYLCRYRDPIRVCGQLYNPQSFVYPRDLDNARTCAKAAQDALQDAGVIPSDGAIYVRLGDTIIHSRKPDHKGLTCLDMTIREEIAA
jgi:hypothetical protein